MNVFQTIKVYPGKWQVKGRRNFSTEELNSISSASVVDSQYGNSVCFVLTSGSYAYIPLATGANAAIGDTIDPANVTLLTLGRAGEADITRVEI